MKNLLPIGLIAVISLVILGVACGGPVGNTNTAANHNSMIMNSNAPMNKGGMDHNSMPMNSNSNMPGMMDMKSSSDAASQPYDLQFIDTMSMHHHGAVQMAETAVKQSTNGDLKAFAQKIITDQQKEIALMKDWREKWYAGKPAAMNMEMSGMSDSMKMMGGGMMKMQTATGKEFDLMFLDMMTPHHQGAITMAKEALSKAEHPEIKKLAGEIIKAQESEIKIMANWKSAWSK